MLKFTLNSTKSPGPQHSKHTSLDNHSISRQDMTRLSILSPKNPYESPDNSFYGSSPKNMVSSARNSAGTKMFSTLQNFNKPIFSTSGSPVNKRGLDAMFYENKGSALAALLQKEKLKTPSDTARIESQFRHDYGNNGIQRQPSDDVEDVKRLDEWQMALKRQQVLGSIIKPNELLEQHKRREINDNRERDDFPKVKQELFNRIVADSDNEEEGKKYQKEKLPALLKDSKNLLGGDNNDFTNDGFKNGAISLEVVQRENNKEILSDLINKKIKEYMNTANVSGMSDEQLRVHVKKVAEKVVVQFKTLKGPAGSLIVHNCVEQTIKLLKTRRDDSEVFQREPQRQNNMDNEVFTDYEMMENLLMEKFELCEQDTEDLRTKVKDLTVESYNLKRELITLQAQLETIQKATLQTLTEGGTKEIAKGTFKLIPMNGNRRASRMGGFNSKMQNAMLEKQSEVIDLSKKAYEIKEKLAVKQQELQLRESELENIRGQMDYYKTQLRDLYYKCLKDDAALLKEGKNKKSYAWVIRSLWKIKEEIKDQAFPSYLDAPSMKYLIDYARAQNDLEEYCKQNNIMNLVSNAEDFKCLNKKLESGLPHETSEETMWTAENCESMKLPKFQIKDLNTLLGDVHIQMAALKRINLKAKRQVPIGRNAFKAKNIAYKWEEVDPTDMDRVISHQDQTLSTFEAVDSAKTKKLRIEDTNKIIWDQGMEKLKGIFAMQKKELDRLFKQNFPKELDDRLKYSLQKTFLFLFGKLGQESFSRFLREKNAYDQNAQGKAKKANLSTGLGLLTKIPTTSVPSTPASPTSLASVSQIVTFRNTFGSNFYKGEPFASANSSPKARLHSSQVDQEGFRTTKDSFSRIEMRTSSIGKIESAFGMSPRIHYRNKTNGH